MGKLLVNLLQVVKRTNTPLKSLTSLRRCYGSSIDHVVEGYAKGTRPSVRLPPQRLSRGRARSRLRFVLVFALAPFRSRGNDNIASVSLGVW